MVVWFINIPTIFLAVADMSSVVLMVDCTVWTCCTKISAVSLQLLPLCGHPSRSGACDIYHNTLPPFLKSLLFSPLFATRPSKVSSLQGFLPLVRLAWLLSFPTVNGSDAPAACVVLEHGDNLVNVCDGMRQGAIHDWERVVLDLSTQAGDVCSMVWDVLSA